MSDQLTKPLRFFVSYAHEDESYKDNLAKHLSPLKRSGVIASWDDRQIPIGGEWDHQIKSEMQNADVILLLISSDFLNSSYCNDVEVKRAMQRHEDPSDGAVVVPIILRPCDWTGAVFAKLQALPKNAEPISRYSDKDEAYLFIVKQIRNLINSKNKIVSPPAANPTNLNVAPGITGATTPLIVSEPIPQGPNLDEIRNMIAENKTEKAIETMMAIAKEKDEDVYNSLIIQSGRLRSAKKNSMMGVSSDSDTRRSMAQINVALLETLKSL